MRIAVTGAGGRLGGQVVDLLAGEHQVVALARRSLPRSANVSVAIADYMDQRALHAALRDVETLVFVSSDGETERLLQHHHNVVRAVVDCGVRHVVALSGLDADLASPFCYAVTNGYTERLLADAGCRVSVARASLYTEFFMRWLDQARTSGEIRLPAGAGRISLVSRADVGRCLAALTMADGKADGTYDATKAGGAYDVNAVGGAYDVTGPAALDVAEIAAVAGREWGTPVRYVDLTPADYCVEMARSGEDPWWMYAFSSMFAAVREQRWSAVSDAVSVLTGRPPLSLLDVLRASASASAR